MRRLMGWAAVGMALAAIALVPGTCRAGELGEETINLKAGSILYDSQSGTLTFDVGFYYHDVKANATTHYFLTVLIDGQPLGSSFETFEVVGASNDCFESGDCPLCIGGCGRTRRGGFLVCTPQDCDLPYNASHCDCYGARPRDPLQVGTLASGVVIQVVVDTTDLVDEWDEEDNTSELVVP